MADIYLLIEGKQEGPFSEEEVRRHLAEGLMPADLPAWREGLADWAAVSSVLTETNAPAVEPQSKAQAEGDAPAVREPKFPDPPLRSETPVIPRSRRDSSSGGRSSGTRGRATARNNKQRISLVFFILAISVPLLTAILNAVIPQETTGDQTSDGVYVETSPYDTVAVSGPFTWRFFEWHILGNNSVTPTDFDRLLRDWFGTSLDTARTISALLDFFDPTLFHLFLLLCLSR